MNSKTLTIALLLMSISCYAQQVTTRINTVTYLEADFQPTLDKKYALMLSQEAEGRLVLWDIALGKPVKQYMISDPDSVLKFYILPNPTRFITVERTTSWRAKNPEALVKLRELPSFKVIKTFKIKELPIDKNYRRQYEFHISHDGRYVSFADKKIDLTTSTVTSIQNPAEPQFEEYDPTIGVNIQGGIKQSDQNNDPSSRTTCCQADIYPKLVNMKVAGSYLTGQGTSEPQDGVSTPDDIKLFIDPKSGKIKGKTVYPYSSAWNSRNDVPEALVTANGNAWLEKHARTYELLEDTTRVMSVSTGQRLTEGDDAIVAAITPDEKVKVTAQDVNISIKSDAGIIPISNRIYFNQYNQFKLSDDGRWLHVVVRSFDAAEDSIYRVRTNDGAITYSMVFSRKDLMLDVSPDGNFLLTRSGIVNAKGELQVSFESANPFAGETGIFDALYEAVAYWPQNQVLLDFENGSRLINVVTGKVIASFHMQCVRGKITRSGNGKAFASQGCEDDSFTIWNAANGKSIFRPKYSSNLVGFLNRENAVVGLEYGKVLTFYNSASGKLIRQLVLTPGDYIRNVAISPDEQFFYVSTATSTTVIDTKTGNELITGSWLANGDYVHIHPSGLFDASPSLRDIVYQTRDLSIVDKTETAKYAEPGLWEKVMKGEKLRMP